MSGASDGTGTNHGGGRRSIGGGATAARDIVKTKMVVLLAPCESDPKGAVHKSWALAVFLKAVLFITAVVVALNLETTQGSSLALLMAAIWTALVEIAMAVLGTYILKRHPTSFSIGFFLGLLIVVSQQHLILFATFTDYSLGTQSFNRLFATLALALCIVFLGFALVLSHFREHILKSPIDLKSAAAKVGGGFHMMPHPTTYGAGGGGSVAGGSVASTAR